MHRTPPRSSQAGSFELVVVLTWLYCKIEASEGLPALYSVFALGRRQITTRNTAYWDTLGTHATHMHMRNMYMCMSRVSPPAPPRHAADLFCVVCEGSEI